MLPPSLLHYILTFPTIRVRKEMAESDRKQQKHIDEIKGERHLREVCTRG